MKAASVVINLPLRYECVWQAAVKTEDVGRVCSGQQRMRWRVEEKAGGVIRI